MVDPSRKSNFKEAANRINIHCRRGWAIFSSYLAVNGKSMLIYRNLGEYNEYPEFIRRGSKAVGPMS